MTEQPETHLEPAAADFRQKDKISNIYSPKLSIIGVSI